MRAARYYGKGDIRVEDVAEAQIREPDDVLIAPFYCGICGTDLHEYAVGPIVTPTTPHPLTGVTLRRRWATSSRRESWRSARRCGTCDPATASRSCRPSSAAGAGTAGAARATSA